LSFCKLTPENLRYFDSKSITVLSPEPFFLAQICIKSFSGWGFAPNHTGGAHSAPSGPLAGKQRWERKGRRGRERERKGRRGREGKGREGRLAPIKFKSGYAFRHLHPEKLIFWFWARFPRRCPSLPCDPRRDETTSEKKSKSTGRCSYFLLV